MTTLREFGATTAAAVAALLAPVYAAAQEAPAPMTQDMDFTPILLGAGAVALVVLAFFLVRSASRRGAAAQREADPSRGRQLQKP